MTKFDLTINGKVISFHIGIGFLGEYQDKFDLDINSLISKIDKNPWKGIPSLMYESALYRAKGNLDFSYDDLLDMIDEDGGFASDAFIDFLKRFTDSLTKDVPKSKGNGSGSKKK